MPWSVNSSGGVITLAPGDALDVHGEQLIINGIGAYMDGWPGVFPLDYPVSLSLSRFDQLNADTLAPEYLAPLTVLAQVKAGEQEQDHLQHPDDGPGQPRTYKVIYLQEADRDQSYPIIRVVLRDRYRGLMYPGIYTVQLVPYSLSGGDAELRRKPTATPGTPRTLNPLLVDLRDQIDFSRGQAHLGDALIRIPREQATQDELLGQTWIDITPRNGQPIRYRIRGGPGVQAEQTHSWRVYLERMRP